MVEAPGGAPQPPGRYAEQDGAGSPMIVCSHVQGCCGHLGAQTQAATGPPRCHVELAQICAVTALLEHLQLSLLAKT